MHVVDGLEEREHGTVVGDAAPTHVVALHAVKEGGDGVLQSLQKLLMVLLRLPVLVLLLKAGTTGKQSEESHLWSATTTTNICSQYKVSTYLHYVDRLDRDMSFYRLTDCRKGLSQWHRGRG